MAEAGVNAATVPATRFVTFAEQREGQSGTGEDGFSGDGGPATAALLDSPSGVAVDGAGNLFIADSGNDLIRILMPAAQQRDLPKITGRVSRI